MKNDVLEQLVEDYLRELGYFTQHNIPYRTNNFGTHSDIDVLGVHALTGEVVVVSCKAYQSGIRVDEILNALTNTPDKVIRSRTMRQRYREIADKDWASALQDKVYELTGKKEFTFYLAVVHYRGNKDEFENFSIFRENVPNSKVRLLDFREMIEQISKKDTQTPSHSELGRIIQLLKASGGEIVYNKTKRGLQTISNAMR